MAATGNDRRQHLITGGACLFVAVLGLLRLGGILGFGGGPPELGTDTVPAAAPDRARDAEREQEDAGLTLLVPRIGLEARVVELGIGSDQELEVPRRLDQAGWWTGGPRPGDAGPAVIVGHIGSAVFRRLHELLPGDEVVVRDAEGPTSRFLVTHSEQAERSRVPMAVVDGEAAEPQLRLVTGTGNLVVHASLSP